MSALNSIGSIPTIKPIQLGEIAGISGRESLDQKDYPSFANMLKRMVNDVSQLNEEAQDAIAAFVRGEDVELHQVMAAVEEANLSLGMLVEIKNKLVDAYRTVISMQA